MRRLLLLPLAFVLGTAVRGADPSDSKSGQKCRYPGDCVQELMGVHFGKCESRSAIKQQIINASPEERRRIWAQRHMNLNKRIKHAYEADEDQAREIERILQEEFEAHRQQMGEAATELRNLEKRKLARLTEYADTLRETKHRILDGEQVEIPLPSPDADPLLLDLHRRIVEIKQSHPLDWDTIADRIEKAVTPGQAERGRLRLAEEMPHYFTPRTHRPNVKEIETPSRSAHPWDEYTIAFIDRHSLDRGQADAAKSILSELKEKAERMRRSVQAEINDALDDADWAVARLRMDACEEAVDQLFEELKSRLHSLLTEAQLHHNDAE